MLRMLERLRRRRDALTCPTRAAAFRERYEGFKELLDSNSELLTLLAEVDAMLAGDAVFGMAWVRSRASRIAFHGGRVVHGLNRLSGGGYRALAEVMADLNGRIRELAEARRVEACPHLVLPYAAITRAMVDWVGGKNAALGELAALPGVRVPPGFAVTTAGYELFLAEAGLEAVARRAAMDLDPADPASARCVSENIQHAFLRAPLPAALERAILGACAAIPGDGPLALRSSAIGEDGELSYAGQYLSVLNVPRDRVAGNYKRVLASLFTPRAIAYRLHQGIIASDLAMSVGVLAMVDAHSAGVAYSRHPADPARDAVLVNAAWGLGAVAVDGAVQPDEYLLGRGAGHPLLAVRPGAKTVRLAPGPAGRLEEEPGDPELARAPCLDEARARLVAATALALEEHFGAPQDMEWAFDRTGALFVLQARPLRAVPGGAPAPPPVGAEVLLAGGAPACPGQGSGPVCHVLGLDDVADFPQGAVLVARHSSPKYVAALARASAVVAEVGSATGHMAALAREFRVPAVFGLPGALAALPAGLVVTVDGSGGRVYRGAVTGATQAGDDPGRGMRGTPVHAALDRLAALAVPLHLTDPGAPEFTPAGCRTVHDVMRYAHERGYEEMFRLGDLTVEQTGAAHRLDTALPLDLYVIDLGGGLRDVAPGQTCVGPEQVASVPFAALLAGMGHPGLAGQAPRPVNLGGFLSVLSRQMLEPPARPGERFGGRSYALISDAYLNFSSRVGYHYSVLDAWCGPRVDENYVSFGFKGGAADDVRRQRRTRAIALILERLGFRVERVADRVQARFRKYGQGEVRDRLDQLGRLLVFTRQMDMLMVDEAMVEHVAQCFLTQCYDLGRAPDA